MDFTGLVSHADPTLLDAELKPHEASTKLRHQDAELSHMALANLRRQEIRSREIIAELRRQELRSREIRDELQRQKLRSRKASAKLRRPPSFERIRPSRVNERGRKGFHEQSPMRSIPSSDSFERIRRPQVYERSRTGLHEQSSRPRSTSGWRSVSSSRSSSGSFIRVIDSRQVLGRNMQEQRARDISVLGESFSKVSGLGSSEQATRTHKSGHKNHMKQPSDGFNGNGRPEAPSHLTRGTVAAYKEREAEHQGTEGFPGTGREGTLKATADLDRATVHIRGWRETNHEGTEELPGSPHESDCDPTSSPSKGALVIYQGEKPRDGTPERLRKTYHRKGSDATSMSQGGSSVIHKGKEETDEATKQLPRRYGIDSVDTTGSRTGALAIRKGKKLEDTSAEEMQDTSAEKLQDTSAEKLEHTSAEELQDTSAEELPKQVGRGVTELDTNLVDFWETSNDNGGRDMPGTSTNQGLPHGASVPISQDHPYGSNLGKTNWSMENNLDDFFDENLRAKRGSQASIGGFRESFSDDDIPLKRAKRRISVRSRPDRFDGDISPWSDNETSSDDIPFTPEHAPERRRKGKQLQRKHADSEGSSRRRARAVNQQKTGSNSNGHQHIDRNTKRLEGSDAHHAPGADSTLAGSSQLLRANGSPADMGMRTLLVYRAVLFATLCALAADTSCVHETELGRRIVQVL